MAGVGAFGYHQVQRRLEREDIRLFVEKKAGEILAADVRIGKLSYLPPLGISLQEIQIQPRGEALPLSIASVRRLLFGYGLLNLIRRDFTLPSSFRLDSPEIRFPSRRISFPFLNTTLSSSHLIPSQLVIEGGRFLYPWGEEGRELVLSNVHFRAKPDPRGNFRLKITSQLEGVAKGTIEVKGSTDPNLRHYALDVSLKNVNFLPESRVPLRELHGDFHISESAIRIEALTSLLHDWEIKGEGRIENWQTQPKIFLDLKRKKGEPPFQFLLQMDLESGKLSGEWSWAGRSYPFQGKVREEGKKTIFSDLQMLHGYSGKGEIDRSNGDYDFWFERDRRRIRIRSNLAQFEFNTEFQLDHVSINRMDWVVAGKARLAPLPKRPSDRGPRFKAEVNTDYLVVEYKPLQDFRGSLEVSSEGVEEIDFRWSGVFHLGGRIPFRGGKAREDLVLRVEGFPLETVRDFAGRPVPSNLSGILEGKLKLRGEPARPEVQGYFTIRDGTIEKLDFDRAIIQFQGYSPYLPLYDSTILKGRNTLKMTGAIDLGLQNIFHGIQIRGPDHLVIWKGISVYWKEGESAIEGERPLGKEAAMGFEVGSGVSDSKGDEPEESHAVLGPKLRF